MKIVQLVVCLLAVLVFQPTAYADRKAFQMQIKSGNVQKRASPPQGFNSKYIPLPFPIKSDLYSISFQFPVMWKDQPPPSSTAAYRRLVEQQIVTMRKAIKRAGLPQKTLASQAAVWMTLLQCTPNEQQVFVEGYSAPLEPWEVLFANGITDRSKVIGDTLSTSLITLLALDSKAKLVRYPSRKTESKSAYGVWVPTYDEDLKAWGAALGSGMLFPASPHLLSQQIAESNVQMWSTNAALAMAWKQTTKPDEKVPPSSRKKKNPESSKKTKKLPKLPPKVKPRKRPKRSDFKPVQDSFLAIIVWGAAIFIVGGFFLRRKRQQERIRRLVQQRKEEEERVF